MRGSVSKPRPYHVRGVRPLLVSVLLVCGCVGELGDEPPVDSTDGELQPERVPAYGVHAWPFPPDAQLAELSAAGVRYVRPVFTHRPDQAPDFDSFDRLVARAHAHRMRVLPTLHVTGHEPPSTPKELDAWKCFAREVAARYGPGGAFWAERAHPLPIRAWEIWNEPNIGTFWAEEGGPDPVHYAAVLRAARSGIRHARPRARIVLGGLSSHGRPRWFLDEVVEAAGGKCLFDAVALHPYGGSVARSVAHVRGIRRLLDRRRLEDVHIWITEVGWAVPADGWSASAKLTAPSAEAQARRLARLVRTLEDKRRAWRLGPIFWFNYSDLDAHDGELSWWHRCGLFDLRGHKRPSFGVLARTARRRRAVTLPDARCIRRVGSAPSCAEADGPGDEAPDPAAEEPSPSSDDSGTDEPSPSGDCGTIMDGNRRRGLHRFYSPERGQHVYVLSPEAASSRGYDLESYNYFFLYGDNRPGLRPLRRCRVRRTGAYMYTTDRDCRGAEYQGVVGHVATRELCGAVPLYELVLGRGRDLFYTISAHERDVAVARHGYRYRGIAGYVWLRR